MSDRIGVMQAGRLIQVGTPNQIYSTPTNRFVSEFIGDVNVIAVRIGPSGKLISDDFAADFSVPKIPVGFTAGHLVVRPEFVRFLAPGDATENRLMGRIYNEYALGSRIQYQVRVGEAVFIVEKLRQQAFAGKLDDAVEIGWSGADSILVSD